MTVLLILYIWEILGLLIDSTGSHHKRDGEETGKHAATKKNTWTRMQVSAQTEKEDILQMLSHWGGDLWLLLLYQQGHIMVRNWVCCCVCLLLGSGVLATVMAAHRTYRGSKAVKQRNIPDWMENRGRSGCTWAWMCEGVGKKIACVCLTVARP